MTLTRGVCSVSTFEFILIKPSVATGSGVPGSYAGHSSVPSPDRGHPASTGVSGWHILSMPEHSGSLGCHLHCAQCLDQRLMVCPSFLWAHRKKGATQDHRIDKPLKLAELAAHLVRRSRYR